VSVARPDGYGNMQPNLGATRGRSGAHLEVKTRRLALAFIPQTRLACNSRDAPAVHYCRVGARILACHSTFRLVPLLSRSSWIGGLRAGVAATVVSTLLVWWSFVPPQHTLVKEEPRYVLSAAMFVAMGILFSLFHDRLRRATQQASAALRAARLAGEELRDVNQQIRRLIQQASDEQQISRLKDFGFGLSPE
jgi:Domain of unknown function (DUF4118)